MTFITHDFVHIAIDGNIEHVRNRHVSPTDFRYGEQCSLVVSAYKMYDNEYVDMWEVMATYNLLGDTVVNSRPLKGCYKHRKKGNFFRITSPVLSCYRHVSRSYDFTRFRKVRGCI